MQRLLPLGGKLLQDGLGFFALLQNVLGVEDILLPLRREHHAIGLTIQQLDARLPFQCLDRKRDGRLGDKQLLAGFGVAAVMIKCGQVGQPLQIQHNRTPFCPCWL